MDNIWMQKEHYYYNGGVPESIENQFTQYEYYIHKGRIPNELRSQILENKELVF